MRSPLRSSPALHWTIAALASVALLLFVPFGRGVIVALTQRHLLGLMVTAVYLLSAGAVAYHVVFNVRLSDAAAFAALALLAAATGALALGLSVPEERVHFVEYGVLTLLFRRALAWHVPPARQYAGAWLLGSAVGWADELVQGATPERYYDLHDVLINSVGALLAVLLDEALHDRLGWRGRG